MKNIFALVQRFGTSAHYLCIRNKKHNVMRNTEYNLEKLASINLVRIIVHSPYGDNG